MDNKFLLHFGDLSSVCDGIQLSEMDSTATIDHLVIDSRKAIPARGSLFFAITGPRHDGHDYIEDLYKKGIRQFIVEKEITIEGQTNMLLVENSNRALQQIAALQRSKISIPVIGITGSNGKTIVKEWLSQLLSPHRVTIKNPGSYNSQVGVPLAVWPINTQHELGIFEAGISQPDEMASLERIIQPTLGLFTNIGSAHGEHFSTTEEKAKEKALLFKACKKVIYCKDHPLIDAELKDKGFTWGEHEEADIRIMHKSSDGNRVELNVSDSGEQLAFNMPFTNNAAVENAMHCITVMLYFGYDHDAIQSGINTLSNVQMRLELKRGINNCILIDDTYNSDLGGVQVALDFLSSQSHAKKTVILSDVLQSGLAEQTLFHQLMELIQAAGVTRTIGIGPSFNSYTFDGNFQPATFNNTEEFLQQFDFSELNNEAVLIKGARPFGFEKVVKRLEEKIHGTQLEINIDALTHNLNFYRSRLNGSKLMVMVKAFAYGSGSLQVANLLQFHRVDYLGVAYADEGVALRHEGISLPIMVMNPSVDSFSKIVEYGLEPEIYNLHILSEFLKYLEDGAARIHIKIDSGMHRLGFCEAEIEGLCILLQAHPNVEVKSIFSHLAGADEATHNAYSHKQAKLFERLSSSIMNNLGIKPLRHLVNSPGIIRFPEYHYDMVRLGIGLYGIEATGEAQDQLRSISSLKTIISQLNFLKKGETIGYSRKGEATDDMTVATIAIGYADGYSRAFSNGVGEVCIKGKRAPTVGNVCMDMVMVDVTGMNVKVGDEVEVFGPNISITEISQKINTIPYEILSSVSQRVKRIYHTE